MKTLLTLGACLAVTTGGAALAQTLSPNETSADAARRAIGAQRPQTGGENITVQGRGADTNPSGQPRTNLPDWTAQQGNRADEAATDPTRPSNQARTGAQQPAAATAPAYPSHWTGDAAAWERHRAACAERYRTYDAATDMFYARPGVQQRCRLAMP